MLYHLYMTARSNLQRLMPKEIRILKYLLTIEDPEECMSALRDAFTPGDEIEGKDVDCLYTYVFWTFISSRPKPWKFPKHKRHFNCLKLSLCSLPLFCFNLLSWIVWIPISSFLFIHYSKLYRISWNYSAGHQSSYIIGLRQFWMHTISAGRVLL